MTEAFISQVKKKTKNRGADGNNQSAQKKQANKLTIKGVT
jgi:hypothetical protein